MVATGRRYTYEFTVHNRAGTYWYHPHPHKKTGLQVYAGLAGLFLYHSHNLEHEDMGMMRNYYVRRV